MILPMHIRFGQVCAQIRGAAEFPLRNGAVHGMILNMETCVVRTFSCSSVFRYPSPFGWSCGVSVRSPIFSLRVARNAKTGESAAVGNVVAGTRSAQERGTNRCKSKQRSSVSSRSQRLAHVETHLASKRSSVQAQGPSRPQPYRATSWRGRWSVAQPTLSIAKNSPANADLISQAATRPDRNHRTQKHEPSPRHCATVAFLLPMRAA